MTKQEIEAFHAKLIEVNRGIILNELRACNIVSAYVVCSNVGGVPGVSVDYTYLSDEHGPETVNSLSAIYCQVGVPGKPGELAAQGVAMTIQTAVMAFATSLVTLRLGGWEKNGTCTVIYNTQDRYCKLVHARLMDGQFVSDTYEL